MYVYLQYKSCPPFFAKFVDVGENGINGHIWSHPGSSGADTRTLPGTVEMFTDEENLKVIRS